MPYAIRDHHYHTLLQALSSLLFSGLGPSCPNKDGTDKHSKALQPMMKVSGQSPAYCFTFHNTVTPELCCSRCFIRRQSRASEATVVIHWSEKPGEGGGVPCYAILSLHFTWSFSVFLFREYDGTSLDAAKDWILSNTLARPSLLFIHSPWCITPVNNGGPGNVSLWLSMKVEDISKANMRQ